MIPFYPPSVLFKLAVLVLDKGPTACRLMRRRALHPIFLLASVASFAVPLASGSPASEVLPDSGCQASSLLQASVSRSPETAVLEDEAAEPTTAPSRHPPPRRLLASAEPRDVEFLSACAGLGSSLVRRAGVVYAAVQVRVHELHADRALAEDEGMVRTFLVLVAIAMGMVVLLLCVPTRPGGPSFRTPEGDAMPAPLGAKGARPGRQPPASVPRFPMPSPPSTQLSMAEVPPAARPASVMDTGRASQTPSVRAARSKGEDVGQAPVPPVQLTLCPELVVPEGSECTLVTPRLGHASAGSRSLDITDLRGSPVFRVAVGSGRGAWLSLASVPSVSTLPLPSRQSARQDGMRITLESAMDETVFAFAKESIPYQGKPLGLEICHPSGATFGRLCASSAETGVYLATCHGSGPVRLQLQSGEGALKVTDEVSGTLLAIAEVMRDSSEHDGDRFSLRAGTSGSRSSVRDTGHERRSVRVGPSVDAGFVALAVLGMEWLELQSGQGHRA